MLLTPLEECPVAIQITKSFLTNDIQSFIEHMVFLKISIYSNRIL